MIRKVVVGTRVNEVEHKALLKLAEMERRNNSEYLRELIRREAQAHGVWPARQVA